MNGSVVARKSCISMKKRMRNRVRLVMMRKVQEKSGWDKTESSGITLSGGLSDQTRKTDGVQEGAQ